MASTMRPLMRSRSASPRSRFFPEMRNGMTVSATSPVPVFRANYYAVRCQRDGMTAGRQSGGGGALFLAPALHRRRNPHRFAVFCDRAPRDLDAGLAQFFHDGVVGQNVDRGLGVDHLLDAMPHRFRGVRFAAMRRRDRGGEEIFQLEDAAGG